MIEVKDVSISFGQNIILDKINLKINKDKITVIAGQSGTGKTVLMKTILGLISPDKGSIYIDGQKIVRSNKKELYKTRRKLAMLFQNSALLDSLNVYQNLALPLVEHTKKKEIEILKLVNDKLNLVGLTGILDKMPSELSGGMRKRVGLARAIIMEPEYIFYDEPTTGLDPIISEEIINLILKIQNELDITSIVITHDLLCIQKTAEFLCFLDKSKVSYYGKYLDLKNQNNTFFDLFFKNENIQER